MNYFITVQMCLDAIRQVLPKNLAMFVLSRWYSTHNAPGSSTGQSEWHMFVKCLLAMIGYDVEKLALTRNVRSCHVFIMSLFVCVCMCVH